MVPLIEHLLRARLRSVSSAQNHSGILELSWAVTAQKGQALEKFFLSKEQSGDSAPAVQPRGQGRDVPAASLSCPPSQAAQPGPRE